jgi:hypothetical protein
MGLVSRDDGWRMPDWLWEQIAPLLPRRFTGGGAIVLGCRIAKRWTQSCWCCGRACNERAQRDGGLLVVFGASALSGVGAVARTPLGC